MAALSPAEGPAACLTHLLPCRPMKPHASPAPRTAMLPRHSGNAAQLTIPACCTARSAATLPAFRRFLHAYYIFTALPTFSPVIFVRKKGSLHTATRSTALPTFKGHGSCGKGGSTGLARTPRALREGPRLLPAVPAAATRAFAACK